MPIIGNPSSGGKKPTTPTIGTATAGEGNASITFTPSTYIGKGTITYIATSSPGSLTGSASTSPVTVSGLTGGTAYTFSIRGNTDYSVLSDASASSNSVTPFTSAYDSIAKITNSGANSNISFTSLPTSYRDLVIFYSIQNNSTSPDVAYVGLNNTGGSMGSGFFAFSSTYAGSNSGVYNANNVRLIKIGESGSMSGTGGITTGEIHIFDYNSTDHWKKVIVKQTTQLSTGLYSVFSGGYVSANGNGAVTSVQVVGGGSALSSVSYAALYGIEAGA